MTVSVLAKVPGVQQYSDTFQGLLHEGPGRIFVVTGNLSKVSSGTSTLFTELFKWTTAEPKRHLDLLVGVFEEKGQLKTDTVVDYLADHIKVAVPKSNSPKKISARFFAVKKWHVKAAGRTGLGDKFHHVEKLLVGSTNISDSAIFGDNFELDVYITAPEDGGLLKTYIAPLANLIRRGVQDYREKDFHDKLQRKLVDHVEFIKDLAKDEEVLKIDESASTPQT